jgi:hypothetical protein
MAYTTVYGNIASNTIIGWWRWMRRSCDKKLKPVFDGLMLYFWWNIWKERNRWIFLHNFLEETKVHK